MRLFILLLNEKNPKIGKIANNVTNVRKTPNCFGDGNNTFPLFHKFFNLYFKFITQGNHLLKKEHYL